MKNLKLYILLHSSHILWTNDLGDRLYQNNTNNSWTRNLWSDGRLTNNTMHINLHTAGVQSKEYLTSNKNGYADKSAVGEERSESFTPEKVTFAS